MFAFFVNGTATMDRALGTMPTIRKGNRKDVGAFERFVALLHAHMQKATNDPYLADTEHAWLSAWQHWFDTQLPWDRGVVFFAEEAKTPVGFVAGKMRAPFLPSPTLSKVGFIALCWVEPEFRRRGIARQLIAYIEGWFKEKGASYVDVEYRLQQTDSDEIWRALGYEPYRTIARKVM